MFLRAMKSAKVQSSLTNIQRLSATFITIPVGKCFSCTQLLDLLTDCPPGPLPLIKLSSISLSIKRPWFSLSFHSNGICLGLVGPSSSLGAFGPFSPLLLFQTHLVRCRALVFGSRMSDLAPKFINMEKFIGVTFTLTHRCNFLLVRHCTATSISVYVASASSEPAFFVVCLFQDGEPSQCTCLVWS